MSEFNELTLIKWIKQVNKDSGIGDDTAVLNIPRDKSLLATSDMLVEDTHFLIDKIKPEELGHKTLAVNLSDIAAMGGWPLYGILSTCWSSNYTEESIKKFFYGLLSLADKYGVKLAGGDTCSGEKISLDLCLLGEVSKGKEVTRGGAKEGDYLIVTGPIGSSAGGLELILAGEKAGENNKSNYKEKITTLSEEEKSKLLGAHLTPEPKVLEGFEIGENNLAHAMIDISDGIASEVNHIAQKSKVGAIIYEEEIPISKPVKKLAKELKKNPLDWAFKGGEDYQLLICVKESNVKKVKDIIEKHGENYSFTPNKPKVIGEILPAEKGIKVKKGDRSIELPPEGYRHL